MNLFTPSPYPSPAGRGDYFEKHEAHEDHEADSAYGGKYLFCSGFGFTKQIFYSAFWRFCLMLPHNPHEFTFTHDLPRWGGPKNGKNMRIMRMYEVRIIKGFYLPCIEWSMAAWQKHEAVMRQHEAYPHVLGPAKPSQPISDGLLLLGPFEMR
jgi:hypothetical protein